MNNRLRTVCGSLSEAVLSVLPLLSQKEASAEAVNAVAYATKYHSDWFWKGAQQIRKWRGTEH